MNYQKYTDINIPNNMELKQIFIAKNTFDYGMILQKGEIFKLYKNGDFFGDDINFSSNTYGIISNDGTTIRTPYFKEDLGKGLSINGLIPKNYYDFLGICNSGEIQLSKNRKYSFAYGIDKENNKFLIRNDEKLLNLDGFSDNYNFSDNGENFLITSLDNKLYLNGKKELYSINNDNEVIFYTIFDNLEWTLIYKDKNIFYVIKNGKEVNKVILEKGFIYENFLHINNDGNKLYLCISKDINNDDKYGISLNGEDIKTFFGMPIEGNPINPYSRFYGRNSIFISNNSNSIVYKCMNYNQKMYYLIQDNEIIFKSKSLVDSESKFYLGDLIGFEKYDIEIVFDITKNDNYWKKHTDLEEKIKKDFDKIDSLVIGDDGVVKFIGYKGVEIGLYYFYI